MGMGQGAVHRWRSFELRSAHHRTHDGQSLLTELIRRQQSPKSPFDCYPLLHGKDGGRNVSECAWRGLIPQMQTGSASAGNASASKASAGNTKHASSARATHIGSRARRGSQGPQQRQLAPRKPQAVVHASRPRAWWNLALEHLHAVHAGAPLTCPAVLASAPCASRPTTA